jgi:hypothetical protein
MHRILAAIFAAIFTLAAPAASHAAPPSQKDWEVQILLYGWASALDMKASARDITSDVHADFVDLFTDIRWALYGAGELRYQRALLLVDVFGNQLTTDVETGQRTVPSQLLNRGPGASLTIGPFDVETRTTMWVGDAKVGWRALSAPFSRVFGTEQPGDLRRLDVDLFAGVRYWNVNVDVAATVSPAVLTVGGNTAALGTLDVPRLKIDDTELPGDLLRGGARKVEQRADWFDPIVGVRFRGDVTESVSLFLLGDLGGFGIGEASGLTWQVNAGLEWRFAERLSATVSYRALAADRDHGSVTDAILYGPQLGLGLRF